MTHEAATFPSQASGRQWQTLKRRADFLKIAASGLRRVTPGFILQAAQSALHEGHAPRIGFTASRKVGNAVARSRAKRRLRALVDRIFDPRVVPLGFDFVMIGRTEVLSRNFAAMEQDLRSALRKITEIAQSRDKAGAAGAATRRQAE